MSRSHKRRDRRMTTPMWWNRLMNNLPKKRSDKMKLEAIRKGHIDPDGVVFEHPKRPHLYYW